MRVPARFFPNLSASTGVVTLEPGTLRLVANEEDAIPEEVARLLGRTVVEVTTAGDGACALHAAFGLPDTRTEELRLNNARDVLRNLLGQGLPQVRREMEEVLDTVVSGLWTDFLLPYVGAGAAVPRNEEAIFLRHLRSSAQWERVLEAVRVHRERQEAFDAQEAIARNLSGSVFLRALDGGLWRRLAMTANVEEYFASAP